MANIYLTLLRFKYPTVNFIGNKEKITEWISDNIPDDVESVFDAFAGGASVAFAIKRHRKTVLANDVMLINYHINKALVENSTEILTAEDVNQIFSGKPLKGFVYKNFANHYFFPEECMELDRYRKNIEQLPNEIKKSLAYALMRRAMIRKMPYSRFNIRWEKVKQLRDEEYSYEKYGRKRAYHNQSFEYHFRHNLAQYNAAIFDNGKPNKAYQLNIFEAVKTIKADLIYLDPPYTGTMNNYHGFYGFLDSYISGKITKPFTNDFIDKNKSLELFDKLFASLGNYKYWMLSYNSSSYPSKDQLVELMEKYGTNVRVIERKHVYKITGKANKSKNIEYLFLADRKAK